MNAGILREQYQQFLYVFYSLGDGLRFTRKYRLWEGFLKYGWVSRLAILLSIIAGFKEEYNLLFAGGMKYTMLIFLEILIFHITRRTLNILKLESGDPTLKAFIRAQIRMLKISLVCYVLESVFSSLTKTGLGMMHMPEVVKLQRAIRHVDQGKPALLPKLHWGCDRPGLDFTSTVFGTGAGQRVWPIPRSDRFRPGDV